MATDMKLVSLKSTDMPLGLPDLELLFKFELSSCTRDEVIHMCQKLAESGLLNRFEHPLRRTAYDLASAGVVVGVVVPPGYLEMAMDSDRETKLHVTAH